MWRESERQKRKLRAFRLGRRRPRGQGAATPGYALPPAARPEDDVLYWVWAGQRRRPPPCGHPWRGTGARRPVLSRSHPPHRVHISTVHWKIVAGRLFLSSPSNGMVEWGGDAGDSELPAEHLDNSKSVISHG